MSFADANDQRPTVVAAAAGAIPEEVQVAQQQQQQEQQRPPLPRSNTAATSTSPPLYTSSIRMIVPKAIWIGLRSPLTNEDDSMLTIVIGLIGWILLGCIIGILVTAGLETSDTGTSNSSSTTVTIVSNCIGYSCFLLWSISFYPQVYKNYIRQTTIGLSADFCLLNVFGFVCYMMYNVIFYYSPYIHHLYQIRNNNDIHIPIDSNDVAFAVHAFILSTLTVLQIMYYNGIHYTFYSSSYSSSALTSSSSSYAQPSHQQQDDDGEEQITFISATTEATVTTTTTTPTSNTITNKNISWIMILLIILVVIISLYPFAWILLSFVIIPLFTSSLSFVSLDHYHHPTTTSTTTSHTMIWDQFHLYCGTWLDYLYFISSMKICVTLIKYIPQVYSNIQRQSTIGFSIWQIVLDATGSILNNIQVLFLDHHTTKQHIAWYTVISNNPSKFALGMVSLFFDIIFMIQHYILYKNNNHINNTNHHHHQNPSLDQQQFHDNHPTHHHPTTTTTTSNNNINSMNTNTTVTTPLLQST